ncbi:MarR family transcriptional regulator [Paenibacillus radicis (ex Gao et al. 2016)]|uniref:HTH-type transcriptional regulator YvmB n=1 Tax=Paenibacillus radicis (ex Gao et al. 2016) TaxID=1737354 RepID=A0A917GPV9_9BACL|nr:MarR family transcriptional regulator [Paenibacillus radicis (ex Gao et al. 2016)]GGG53050.1 putative HTH-type transcriptional regulator YvmB [Paenibacillus radicis (ex Gao et al. 2016)]
MHRQTLLRQFYDQYLHLVHITERTIELEPLKLKQLAEAASFPSLSLNITAIHVVDCIGRFEPVNGTALAALMRLSKAAITKICTRLTNDGLIARSQLPQNKKEYLFSLTDQGKALYELHEQLHQQAEKEFMQYLEEWSSEDLTTILRFVQHLGNVLEQRIHEGEGEA